MSNVRVFTIGFTKKTAEEFFKSKEIWSVYERDFLTFLDGIKNRLRRHCPRFSPCNWSFCVLENAKIIGGYC
jgi:hypothetical protein